jgi:hypothetical protein
MDYTNMKYLLAILIALLLAASVLAAPVVRGKLWIASVKSNTFWSGTFSGHPESGKGNAMFVLGTDSLECVVIQQLAPFDTLGRVPGYLKVRVFDQYAGNGGGIGAIPAAASDSVSAYYGFVDACGGRR